jgi:hypothetical protein
MKDADQARIYYKSRRLKRRLEKEVCKEHRQLFFSVISVNGESRAIKDIIRNCFFCQMWRAGARPGKDR